MDHDAAQSILHDQTKMKNLTVEAFKAVDKDHSGFLDEKETRDAVDDVCVNLFKCEKWDEEKFTAQWEKLDSNHDNKIDENEFQKLLTWILQSI